MGSASSWAPPTVQPDRAPVALENSMDSEPSPPATTRVAGPSWMDSGMAPAALAGAPAPSKPSRASGNCFSATGKPWEEEGRRGWRWMEKSEKIRGSGAGAREKKRQPGLFVEVRAGRAAPLISPHRCGGAVHHSSAPCRRACAPNRRVLVIPASAYALPFHHLTFSHHADAATVLARSSTNTSGVRPTTRPFSASAAAVRMAARSTGSAMSAVSWREEGERVRDTLSAPHAPFLRAFAPHTRPTHAPMSALALLSSAPPTHPRSQVRHGHRRPVTSPAHTQRRAVEHDAPLKLVRRRGREAVGVAQGQSQLAGGGGGERGLDGGLYWGCDDGQVKMRTCMLVLRSPACGPPFPSRSPSLPSPHSPSPPWPHSRTGGASGRARPCR